MLINFINLFSSLNNSFVLFHPRFQISTCFTDITFKTIISIYLINCNDKTINTQRKRKTRKQLKVRVSQHKGISFRTGNMLNSVEKSKILDHSLDSGHFTSDNNFKILDSCQPFNLRILESIYIHKIKPSLNDHASSVELSILK